MTVNRRPGSRLELLQLSQREAESQHSATALNASAASTTARTSSQDSASQLRRRQSQSSDASESKRENGASMTSLNDGRRKLTSRDYLLIKLASATASIGYLAKRFEVSKSHIHEIVRRPEGFCAICNEWKKGGEIVLDEGGADINWLCDECLNG